MSKELSKSLQSIYFLGPSSILSRSSYVRPSVESRIGLERENIGGQNLAQIFILLSLVLKMGKIG